MLLCSAYLLRQLVNGLPANFHFAGYLCQTILHFAQLLPLHVTLHDLGGIHQSALLEYSVRWG